MRTIRIGTRDSQLAIWQAETVKQMLEGQGISSELVFIKSDGDTDLQTPLYEMGVKGIFTRSLDVALLNDTIDLAVHSYKDVPTGIPQGLQMAAILPRGNYKDVFVAHNKNTESLWHKRDGIEEGRLFYESLALKNETEDVRNILNDEDDDIIMPRHHHITIATSSLRRKAQWLHRYPGDVFENLRGNMNTRLQKLYDSEWEGAIFAAAGLDRINLLPSHAIELDWMVPAPAQGAITVQCRVGDEDCIKACTKLHDEKTALQTGIERDFLRALLGGCATPIGAIAVADGKDIYFRGNIVSPDGKQKIDIERYIPAKETERAGASLAADLLKNGANEIIAGLER
ncbi:MAG: hydroxymethylbilane synthase [Ferruginibacter sp.]